MSNNTVQLLSTNLANTAGIDWVPGVSRKTIQAYMDATGSAAAVVEIIGSNDGAHYHVISTLTLSGANDVEGVSITESWPYIAARTTAAALTGTVTVTGHAMGR